ncbi:MULTISPECIES: TetR/AcrR family transcriptional regulator [Nocardiopsis]|uniref:WHG domain-containing protein n=1 Tax=Nocardiopsis changdeensis TaxID=2831969 RepID=A0ABX8BS24_9ACTN|nr:MULTISPECIES: TetR/AcrR family transcriptional regulator [Nocardiopsis]QUX24558.1 WHG domain-containing protein [Nocardiopsis changdeensis]QYX34946.1 TetR/AcrR family transcriptional regulator [Nocardiopsis sp. MT53]
MPRAGLTPELVVAEAARLVDEQGWEALSLAAVAKRFGVAVPSLYKHVEGLPGLRSGIAVLAANEIGEAVQRAAVGRSGPDALRACADAYRAYAHAHPGRYVHLQRLPRMAAPDVKLDTDPVAVLAAVLRGFGITEDRSVHAVRALRSALHGFVDLEVQGGFGLPEDVDESFALLVEGFVRAYRDWPGNGDDGGAARGRRAD